MDARSSLHPSEETLLSYGLGKLDDASASAVDRHLEECASCRRVIAEMTSGDSFLGRLRERRNPSASTPGVPMSGVSRGASGPASRALTPVQADTLPAELADHPEYEVIRELGRGGMGVVYLAHNRLMGRDEVLKVMGRQIIERPGVLDRFLREIRRPSPGSATRTSSRPTRPSGSARASSSPWSTSKGSTWRRWSRPRGRCRWPTPATSSIRRPWGSSTPTRRGMVHRDIKPGNLMLSRKGDRAVVKVLDFGLAKVDPRGPGRRRPDRSEGPDARHARLHRPGADPRRARSADIRADIYSLGCTLYYLLTGRPPFRARVLYDIFQAHISMDAEPLNLVRPEVPAELAALVAKMMAKDPSRRFQTPGEVAKALTPFFKSGKAASVGTKAELSQAGQPFSPAAAEVSSVPTQPATGVASPPVSKRAEQAVQWESLIDLAPGTFVGKGGSRPEPPRRGLRERRPMIPPPPSSGSSFSA